MIDSLFNNHEPFFLSLLFSLPQCRTYTPLRDTTQMPVGQMPVGGSTDWRPEHWTDVQGLVSLSMCSAQCQGHRQRQHRTEHKGHTPSPMREIKMSDPAGKRTRAPCLGGRDSIDHAMAKDLSNRVKSM